MTITLCSICHIPGAVRLTPNVAYGKQATQNSNVNAASMAIDGNVRSCARIPGTPPPIWWQVDLLEVYEITNVAITTSYYNGACTSFLIISLSSVFNIFAYFDPDDKRKES